MAHTEIAWLESTGSQYIDTGVCANPHYIAEVSFMVAEQTASWDAVFGAWNGSYSRFMNSTDGGIGFQYSSTGAGITAYFESNFPKSAFIDTFHKVRLEKNAAYIDCLPVYTFSAPGDRVSYPYSLYLFALNNTGTPACHGYIRLRYCRIWNDTTLVRDFIPVLDENDIPCLYDKVSGTYFYNKGTGQFGYCRKSWEIQQETLEAFADQARRLSGMKGELTTAQMKAIFAGITNDEAESFPQAETGAF